MSNFSTSTNFLFLLVCKAKFVIFLYVFKFKLVWPSGVKGQSSRERERRASYILLPAPALGIDFVMGGGASRDGLQGLVDLAA